MKKWFSGLLTIVLCMQLFGCTEQTTVKGTAENAKTVELTADMNVSKEEAHTVPADGAAANFAVKLLQNVYDGGEESCILSPYSVLTALGMISLGAKGQTLAQLEASYGMSKQTLCEALSAQNAGPELCSANSIWMRGNEDFSVRQEFLRNNVSYFDAQLYRAAFDTKTVTDINAWVSEHTDGRITQLLDRLDAQASMVLLNALTFDAKWETPYSSKRISQGVFHAADGTQQTTQMLRSEEALYLDNGEATGFIKNYEGGRYCYVALLPNADISLQDYLGSLTGEALLQTLSDAQATRVYTEMPCYRMETAVELKSALRAMGIIDAFDAEKADFSAISDTQQYIDEVLHKTYIKVDGEGTEAAAATAIITRSAAVQADYTVIIDRPYVMAIVDRESKLPAFLGVVNSVGA